MAVNRVGWETEFNTNPSKINLIELQENIAKKELYLLYLYYTTIYAHRK